MLGCSSNGAAWNALMLMNVACTCRRVKKFFGNVDTWRYAFKGKALPSTCVLQLNLIIWYTGTVHSWNSIITKSLVTHSQEFLTPEKCAQHIIIRGLVRVLMVSEVRRILYFLSKKGFVNHGILFDVPRSLGFPKDSKVKELYLLQSHSWVSV